MYWNYINYIEIVIKLQNAHYFSEVNKIEKYKIHKMYFKYVIQLLVFRFFTTL